MLSTYSGQKRHNFNHVWLEFVSGKAQNSVSATNYSTDLSEFKNIFFFIFFYDNHVVLHWLMFLTTGINIENSIKNICSKNFSLKTYESAHILEATQNLYFFLVVFSLVSIF